MIEKLAQQISSLIEKSRSILTPISPFFMLGVLCRPGLSEAVLAARIIKGKAEAGAPTGPSADGTQAIDEAMEVIRAREILNMFRNECRIDVSFAPGTIMTITIGANSAGTVVSKGYNALPVMGYGALR